MDIYVPTCLCCLLLLYSIRNAYLPRFFNHFVFTLEFVFTRYYYYLVCMYIILPQWCNHDFVLVGGEGRLWVDNLLNESGSAVWCNADC